MKQYIYFVYATGIADMNMFVLHTTKSYRLKVYFKLIIRLTLKNGECCITVVRLF